MFNAKRTAKVRDDSHDSYMLGLFTNYLFKSLLNGFLIHTLVKENNRKEKCLK